MYLDANSVPFSKVYDEVKSWVEIVVAAWTIFKAYEWVKDIRETDLKNLKDNMAEFNTSLKEQTRAIVDELKELRSDVRTQYIVRMDHPATARGKDGPKKKIRKPLTK
jgi:hypothetical protein